MNATRDRVKSLFLDAVENCPPERWDSFLDEACGRDEELRHRVRALLDAHRSADSFVREPGPAATVTDASPFAEEPRTTIGPYKLLEPIGEGGMGTVYMAEQTEPVRRRVALKVIKSGMDSRQVLARFEAERQALALMDHPNIAKVLEAGTTDAGRPYFVMELVKGVPITEYCDARKLTLRERLELFIPVCQAVQHAHQKGIIHRDIKPSNVLVAPYDGRPVPKVIDFGVAKATGPNLTERTVYTEFGAVVGTLEYMSPEQAELNQLDVDTRSDIYSLGVLLYELLTGSTPLERKRLEGTAYLELLRLVREKEPPRPSTRLSTSNELPAIAASRGLEPRRLGALLRGELDWVVMKCLEKDRDRRYETANDLVSDIRRYLDDEPVLACPPSAAYRLRKSVRRHKRALTTAGVVVTGLLLAVCGLAASTVLARQAKLRVETALAREQLSSYFLSIALADREWSANNLARADELLERCPPAVRGWEWRYLKRRRGEVLPPMRHRNALHACAISPDGKQLVSSDYDGFLNFWEPNTGQELRPPIRGHEGICFYVAFSPDGGRLASGEDRGVKIWDAKTWRQLHVWKAPAGTVQGLVFGADGRVLACVWLDEEQGAGIWDVTTGERLFALPGHRDLVVGLSLRSDGELLATASADRTVKLWNARTGEAVRTLSGATGFRCVAFSPDGRLVAAGGGTDQEQGIGHVKIWDVETGRERPTITGHGAWSVAFSPRGDRLATGGTDQAVKIWDTASGQEVLTLRGHMDWVMGVAFSPDGHRLASVSGDRTARIWDASPLREGERAAAELFTLRGHTDGVNALAFRPRDRRLATASRDGTIKVWDTQTGHHLHTFHAGIPGAVALAFSPDGSLLAAGGPGRFVTVRDATTGEEVRRLGEGQHTELLTCVAISPDGRHLAAGDQDGLVLISDFATGRVLRRRRFRPHICSVAFSPDPDGRLLAVAVEGTVRLWDTSTDSELAQSPLRHQGFVYGVAFSPDGRHLASVGWDRAVRIWETATWRQEQVILDTAAAQGVAFSPNGQSLTWGTSDSTVRVWQRATGAVHSLRGHLNWVRAVEFSPDGKVIASASRDGTARVWEAPSSPELPGTMGP